MCYCDCDRPDYYENVKRKANRPHQCSECHLPIKQGAYYWRASGVMDGSWYHGKTCQDCQELWDWCLANVECFCAGHYGLVEELLECELQEEPYIKKLDHWVYRLDKTQLPSNSS